MGAGSRFAIILGLCVSGGASALDVNVVGLFPNKAVVQIDGGKLQTISVGQKTAEGVVLLSVEGEGATFEIDGKRVSLGLGHARGLGAGSSNGTAKIIADERGHFMAMGSVNGSPVRFAVDTGATFISMSASEARRLNLDYRKGQPVFMATANGNAPGYKIKLDTVRVGEIVLNSVDAVVMEGDSPHVALLGMSFLSRMNMTRDGEIMTLSKRF
jgi:aspartyl protease family protein